jgi:serine phosphatase RsbU (regulator of sigma subunit)
MLSKLMKYLGRRSRLFLLTTAILLDLVIGYVDILTGVELSLSIFYLLPVTLVAWFSSRRDAYLLSAVSAITWFFDDYLQVGLRSYPYVPYWNAIGHLAIFIVVVWILTRLKQSIESELKVAAEIQQGFLPKDIPEIPGVDISGCIIPSEAVSGDYYDVLEYEQNKVGFCVADVVGHGIPAAILMSSLQAAVKIYASTMIRPKTFCGNLNEIIARNSASAKFITFFYFLLQRDTKRLSYTNAGHNPPILIHQDGSYVLLDKNDLVLGITPESVYREFDVQLKEGDRLVLFTDGLTEQENLFGQQFGVDRLISFIQKNQHLSASALQQAILDELDDYANGIFTDDITILIVDITS